MAAALMFIPSLICALLFREMAMAISFSQSMALVFGVGAVFILAGRGSDNRLLHRETLALVGVGWLLTALYGAMPFFLSGQLSLVDAYFESMSGFTTTGASILTNIEILPKSLLFWRSFTHWLGGLGIILLLIIVLPFLGAGGKLLYRSEMPGLDKSSIKPRIKDSALILLRIYMGLTVVLSILLLLAGMDMFDSLCHTFGALATGGFSTRNQSIASFESPLIEGIIILFMIIAGTSFSLLYCVQKGEFPKALRNSEWRLYLFLLALSFLLISTNLFTTSIPLPGPIGSPESDFSPGYIERARMAAFQTASIMTATGYSTTDFSLWPNFSRSLLLLLMLIGGCSGSTSGGLKVVRVLLLAKMAYWHIAQTFSPKHIRILRLDETVINKDLQKSIQTYFVLYVFIVALSTLALTAFGLPMITSVSAVAACFNGVGPGLDLVGAATNYSFIPGAGKLLLSLLMAMGRLELYAICVLFIPSFWKRY